ncbi:MAG: hypothetical protein ACPGXZ_01710 [Saprospiraceae bacterium]
MKYLLIIALIITTTFAGQAQDEMIFTSSRTGLVENNVKVDLNDNNVKSPIIKNNTGAFGEALIDHSTKNDFTGYSVQLLVTNMPLPEGANVYYYFGDVREEQVSNNEFHYIVGEFKTEKSAKKFLDTYLMKHYTEAKIIEYKKGKRK